MNPTATRRELFLEVLQRNYGKPYRWGGDDTTTGFDCSGLVNEGARSIGLIGRTEDRTAAEWYAHSTAVVGKARPGDLVFRKNAQGEVVHVEIVMGYLEDGTMITLGAAGGGSTTTSLEAAAAQNAYVKYHPWDGTEPARSFLP